MDENPRIGDHSGSPLYHNSCNRAGLNTATEFP